MPNIRNKTWTTTTPATVGDAQFWEDHLLSDELMIRILSNVRFVENEGPDADGNVNVFPRGGLYGQVLTKTADTDAEIEWLDPATSGHTVQNQHDLDMPFEEHLQFLNANVTDDPENGRTIVDCHGEPGEPGKSAYQYAWEAGYTGTEEQFSEDLVNFKVYADDAKDAADDAEAALDAINDILVVPSFTVDFDTGELIYDSELVYSFSINVATGNLEWEVL